MSTARSSDAAGEQSTVKCEKGIRGTMNETVEALNNLRDIHMPPPVSAWPPAPGWWIALGLVMVVAAMALVFIRQRRLRHRRVALNELNRLLVDFKRDGNSTMLVSGLSMLVRRVTLSRFERPRVAGLSGEKWLAFLDETNGSDAFTKGPGRVLITAPYKPKHPVDVEQLITLVEGWIKKVA